ncbi:MAG: hypothetical protein KHY61_10195, partial [Sutterella wadsworthensis]|nr:hypothetical protein [Sutterella wadsworthensis]
MRHDIGVVAARIDGPARSVLRMGARRGVRAFERRMGSEEEGRRPMMKSVCPGCGHEQACGHADVTHCADRVPAAWCSCDMLR